VRKIILISVVASSMLFATTVDNLTTDQTSNIDGSSITSGAQVNQAQTNIDVLYGTTSDVDDVTITQTSVGNLISDSTINGGGSEVTAIVEQGVVYIENSKVSDVGLDSDNRIQGTTITGISYVGQSLLTISDSNSTDSTANDVDILADNAINGSTTITDSLVLQSSTRLTDGSTVSGLDLIQDNTITDESSITASSATQASTTVNNSTLENLSSVWGYGNDTNMISNATATNNTTLTQNSVEVKNGSTVKDVKNGATNWIQSITVDNSNLSQNVIGVDNSAVTDLKQYRLNDMTDITATNSSLTQNVTSITGSSTVRNLSSNTVSENNMQNITANGSSLSQNDIDISDHSTVTDSETIQTNTIDATMTNGSGDDNVTNSTIAQGKILIASSDVRNIQQGLLNDNGWGNYGVVNDIKDVAVMNTSILTQANTDIANSTVDTLVLEQRNNVANTKMNTASLSQGSTIIHNN